MTKLYLDTNVLVYSVEDSRNPFGKDISTSSSDLLFDAVSCKYQVIISSWTLTELSNLRKLDQASMLLAMLKPKIIKLSHTQEELDEAKRTNPDHFQDELHGMLALKADADYLVTRNIDDFKKFRDRIQIVKPEWLL